MTEHTLDLGQISEEEWEMLKRVYTNTIVWVPEMAETWERFADLGVLERSTLKLTGMGRLAVEARFPEVRL